mmetsp:Transcript_24439/g.52333  ORF Transcript_24439/g.52333 Transcript_24439/m.52333 type:complete len:238 (+) Transcript_24439:76-789(+)|eukprot:CAMPEP_0172554390 /NCGR_PEP_ID=MMETSP1067-20121228/54340_1 /TAXON_ID=265564 ORGANISM="Thalassiosira punctigera, Strain Tpunct2005C2" /NCGR_SAMPLE_ID=MMETSP1067 /ASSEMBLY_ACC=CAM_ASM_000444 /LENGTH=237 /DNA_ID=CAMNT_0013342751 /DNA_START=71 /DNA_END=784 /DNA_ORIENTATION=+
MGFLRLRSRPKKSIRRSVAEPEGASRPDENTFEDDRLGARGGDSSRGDADRASSSSSSEPPAPPPLDDSLHAPRDVRQDVIELIRKRSSSGVGGKPSCMRSAFLSSRRSSDDTGASSTSTASRVSFVDEELGLTPRHVVTETHYRPRTTNEHKRELYYTGREFGIFEQEDLHDKIQFYIERLTEQKQNRNKEGQKVVNYEMEIQNLILRVQQISKEVGTKENSDSISTALRTGSVEH